MANAETPEASQYYIPHHSPWPIVGSVALFTTMLGAITYLNDWSSGLVFLPGAILMAILFFGWFSVVIDENQAHIYNLQVDRSFRMGMMWFIFSEVMFFGAFFGALYYTRELSVPWLGGEGSKFLTNLFLWKDYDPTWPTGGPANVGGSFETISPLGLPAINTALLLTSGMTVTVAHHAVKSNNRLVLKIF